MPGYFKATIDGEVIVAVPDAFLGKTRQKGWVIHFHMVELGGLFGWETALDVNGSWGELNIDVLKEHFLELTEAEMLQDYPKILEFFKEATAIQAWQRLKKVRIRRIKEKQQELKAGPPLKCHRKGKL